MLSNVRKNTNPMFPSKHLKGRFPGCLSVHKSRTFEAETERGKDDLIRAQYAPGIKRPSPGVNKKPFTCSFQDRPFQNPETLETCDRQFWTNATKRTNKKEATTEMQQLSYDGANPYPCNHCRKQLNRGTFVLQYII